MGKVPHRRRRHLQQQGGQQAQDALMADDQQMVKMAAVGQRWDKLADAAGKILESFRRWWGAACCQSAHQAA